MLSREELAQVASPGGYGTSNNGLSQVLETLQEEVSNRDDVKTSQPPIGTTFRKLEVYNLFIRGRI